MARLAGRLFVLLLIFAASMSFFGLAVFVRWWYALIGAGLLLAFAVLGGGLVPRAEGRLPWYRERPGAALLQVFGSLCATMALTMGLVTWCYGNRSLSGNNAYQALGLIIFLALLGVGVQGTVATMARLSYVWTRSDQARAAASGQH